MNTEQNQNRDRKTVNRSRRRKRFRLTKRGRSLLYGLLTILFLSLFLFSAVKLIKMAIGYHKAREVYDEIRSDSVLTVMPDDPPPADSEEPAGENSVSEGNGFDEPYVFSDDIAAAEAEAAAHAAENASYIDSSPSSISGSLPWEKEENITAETGIIVKWETLLEQNPDTVAWLYLPDSDISYPVVQSEDNYYYLDHNFRRKPDDSGALYFDYRNFLEDDIENWIIYGHRRNDKSMFGNLGNYSKASYLEAHPKMYLLLRDRAYRVDVFACRTVHAESRYFNTFFKDTADFSDYINKAIRQSYWPSPVDVEASGPILTLATCSTYIGDSDPRLLVHGKLVPLG